MIKIKRRIYLLLISMMILSFFSLLPQPMNYVFSVWNLCVSEVYSYYPTTHGTCHCEDTSAYCTLSYCCKYGICGFIYDATYDLFSETYLSSLCYLTRKTCGTMNEKNCYVYSRGICPESWSSQGNVVSNNYWDLFLFGDMFPIFRTLSLSQPNIFGIGEFGDTKWTCELCMPATLMLPEPTIPPAY